MMIGIGGGGMCPSCGGLCCDGGHGGHGVSVLFLFVGTGAGIGIGEM